ncbi:MAG: protease modulator HflC [Alphaproteobacteria bacterium]|jgi:membrane protease subunit HflC|nr:protease modulator HflC [Alphaproteobacteria bacterium]
MERFRIQPLYLFGGFGALILLLNTFFTVSQTQQVMVVSLGQIVREVDEPGLHMKVPFLHQAVVFDKRILETDSPAEEVQTLDKERVVVDSFTRWRITNAGQFFISVRTVGTAQLRLDTIVNSALREEVANVRLVELVDDKRDDVMTRILRRVQSESRGMGIEVVDVRLKRADLPEANSESVFRRMRAEREKEALELRAKGEEEAAKIRAEAEKERTIILAEATRDAQVMRGQGDGQSIRITGQAFSRDADFYKLTRSLEVYRAALTPSSTLMVLDPSTEVLDKLVNP